MGQKLNKEIISKHLFGSTVYTPAALLLQLLDGASCHKCYMSMAMYTATMVFKSLRKCVCGGTTV